MKGPAKPDPYSVEQGKKQAAAAGEPAATTPSSDASTLFSSRTEKNVHVIRFSRSDVLDAQYIEQLGDDIYHYLKPHPDPRVVIDLGNVNHLSSAALGMLIALNTVVTKKQKGKLCLADVDANLMQVFKITKLHKLLKIHDSTAPAVESLA
jgi:anti-anti-sigma factor